MEEDRLREEYVAKEEEKRQREAARAARGSWGCPGVVVGCAGGVVR